MPRAQPTALGERAVAPTLDPLRADVTAPTNDSLDDSGVAQIGERASSHGDLVASRRAVVGMAACSDGDGDLAPNLAGRPASSWRMASGTWSSGYVRSMLAVT